MDPRYPDEVLLQNKKYKHLLEPLDARIRAVEQFVALVRPSIRCDAVPLQVHCLLLGPA